MNALMVRTGIIGYLNLRKTIRIPRRKPMLRLKFEIYDFNALLDRVVCESW